MDNCATVHDIKSRNEKGEAKIVRFRIIWRKLKINQIGIY
jgi:hypothetical protein